MRASLLVRGLVIVGLLGCTVVDEVRAEPVSIAFEIDVRHAFGDLQELFGVPIAIGDVVAASLTYNTSIPDTAPSPIEGNYRFAGSLVFETATPVTLPVEDLWVFDETFDPRPGFDDVFTAIAVSQTVAGFDSLFAELSFRGGGRTGDALPSAAEVIAAFTEGGIRFAAWETDGNPPFDSGTHELAGTVRLVSEAPEPVPEPGTMLLCAAGAAALWRRRRSRTDDRHRCGARRSDDV